MFWTQTIKNQRTTKRNLKKIKGVKITEMSEPEECCGFGGSFSIKYGGISVKLLKKMY